MKKTVSTIAIAAGFSVMGLAIAQAKDVSISHDLTSFDKIIIENTGVGIDVKVGKAFSVTMNGSEKWANKIILAVEGNALVISQKDRRKNRSMNIDSDDRIIITMPEFTGLDVKGAVDADISGVDSDELEFEINGAGNIEIEGKCGSLNVELNGAGNFEGPDLKCENVTIEINGAGNVEAYGSKSADLEINGIGNIDLYGNPKNVSKDSGWFSNITIHK